MSEAGRKEAGGKEPAGEKIAKVIARAGVCSRRDAERLVTDGRVRLDGKVLASPAERVRPGQVVMVDNRPIAEPEQTRLFRYHKTRGVLTTARDTEGRSTIYDNLPPGLPRLMPVGRLDINSEGLLLLTNDGELKRRLELPSTGWIRRYKVRAHGEITDEQLARLGKGVTVEGVVYGPIEARLERVQGDNCWIGMALREGKNREVRRVLAHLGLEVNRLIRLTYGPFQLGSLGKRLIEEVPPRVLREQLGGAIRKPVRERGRR